MDILQYLLEVGKWVIPSMVMFGVTYWLITIFLDNEYKKRLLDQKVHNQSIVTPIRLQAYERMTLFLERISPENMLMRLNIQGTSALELKHQMTAEIHTEFSHNSSQQVYLSPQSWILIKEVKEEVINLLNVSFASLPPGATGIDLSKAILENLIKRNEIPSQKALEFLKKEFQLMFV